MMSANEPLIVLEKISKVFLTDEVKTHAVKDIDLVIYKGEYVSITGPSGCGKSTLLSLLGLLDEPSSGKYVLNSVDTHKLNVIQRSKIRNSEIGFIFQNFNLIGDLNVFENVALPLSHRNLSKSERDERTISAIKKVGMEHRLKHYPAQLSGGQQQRIAVARALVGSPNILFADEPTGNLDSNNGFAVMELLKKLNQEGTTICMVTHDQKYIGDDVRKVELLDGVIQ